MVHKQGEVIDSIEANVQITNVSVQEATSQLRRATDYTVSTDTFPLFFVKKCLFLLFRTSLEENVAICWLSAP